MDKLKQIGIRKTEAISLILQQESNIIDWHTKYLEIASGEEKINCEEVIKFHTERLIKLRDWYYEVFEQENSKKGEIYNENTRHDRTRNAMPK